MSDLGDRRKLFSSLIPRLLNKMLEDGYQPMIDGDGKKHKIHSLHYDGLAMDIILTRNGDILDKTEDHTEFGVFWESLNHLCRWGGRFSDGNHYSVEYQGRK